MFRTSDFHKKHGGIFRSQIFTVQRIERMKSINLWKHFEEENNFIEIDEEAAQIRSNFFYTEVHITFYLGSKSERMEKKVSSI